MVQVQDVTQINLPFLFAKLLPAPKMSSFVWPGTGWLEGTVLNCSGWEPVPGETSIWITMFVAPRRYIKRHTRWWFQPIYWKNTSQSTRYSKSFPILGGKQNNMWNHQLVLLSMKTSFPRTEPLTGHIFPDMRIFSGQIMIFHQPTSIQKKNMASKIGRKPSKLGFFQRNTGLQACNHSIQKNSYGKLPSESHQRHDVLIGYVRKEELPMCLANFQTHSFVEAISDMITLHASKKIIRT